MLWTKSTKVNWMNQCRSYSAAMETITRSRSSIPCSSICQRTTANMPSCVRQWMAFINIYGRYLLGVMWKSIMSHSLNIHIHLLNHSIINANSNYLLLYIWRSHRFHVTMRMMTYSNIVIPSNRLWVRDTRWVFQWMVCDCSMYHSSICSTILWPFPIPNW